MNDTSKGELTLSSMRADNEKLQKQLDELRKIELNCQREKETLLKRKSELKERKSSDVRKNLPAVSQKLFDQVYPLVNDVCHQQYLLQELKQQLLVAITTKEKDAILSALKSIGKIRLNNGEIDKTDILKIWHLELMNMKKQLKNEERGDFNMFNSTCYDITFEQFSKMQELIFSTCYHGVCVKINIHQNRIDSLHGEPTFTSDPYIDDLQDEFLQVVHSRGSIIEYVKNCVWKGIDDLLSMM